MSSTRRRRHRSYRVDTTRVHGAADTQAQRGPSCSLKQSLGSHKWAAGWARRLRWATPCRSASQACKAVSSHWATTRTGHARADQQLANQQNSEACATRAFEMGALG